jgi:hypothetical protein
VVLQSSALALAQDASATQPEGQPLLERFIRLVDRFFPPIKTLHPLPCHRFDAKTPAGTAGLLDPGRGSKDDPLSLQPPAAH